MPEVALRFVIFYGWLVDGPDGAPNAAARAIAAAQPAALLAHVNTFEPVHANLSRPVLDLLHGAGVRVFAYVTTSYAARERGAVAAEVRACLAAGADGIFFDEVYNFLDGAHTDYYRALADHVREAGKTVVMNTGIAETGEAIMGVTDCLMVEHQWRMLYQRNCWWRGYPAERFMGNSSNEPGARAYLGRRITLNRAVRDTREAWTNGIGWHCSTDRYIWLPPWFEAYTAAMAKEESAE